MCTYWTPMRHPVRILTVFSFYDLPKATGMTPAINGPVLLCVESGGQRAKPAPFCEQSGPLDHERCPTFWGLSLSEATVFLGVYFCYNLARCHQLSQSPLLLCPFTNPLHTNIMLAWGPAVVPSLGMSMDPHCHTISCTSVLARVGLGQSGHPRCQNALSAGCGPTAHRLSHPACLLFPCLTCQSLSCAWLGAASSSCPPHLSTCLSRFWLFLCQPSPHRWARELALLENLL